MSDDSNPTIYCTQKDLAHDVWQKAGGVGDFDAFWDLEILSRSFASLRALISYVWAYASNQALGAYWQKVIDDAKPLAGKP